MKNYKKVVVYEYDRESFNKDVIEQDIWQTEKEGFFSSYRIKNTQTTCLPNKYLVVIILEKRYKILKIILIIQIILMIFWFFTST